MEGVAADVGVDTIGGAIAAGFKIGWPMGVHMAVPIKSVISSIEIIEDVQVVEGVDVVVGVDTIGGAISAGFKIGWPMGVPMAVSTKCMADDKFCT